MRADPAFTARQNQVRAASARLGEPGLPGARRLAQTALAILAAAGTWPPCCAPWSPPVARVPGRCPAVRSEMRALAIWPARLPRARMSGRGSWHWELAHRRALTGPVPASGRPRLWRLPPAGTAQLRARGP